MARTPRAARSLPLPPGPPPAAPQTYRHRQDTAARPEAGAAPRFKGKKEATTYRYDSSLSPALEWDQKPAREVAAWLLTCIEEAAALPGQTFPERRVLRGADGGILLSVAGLQDALAQLKAIQKPFLNWSGKAERLSFDVPTLPLFIHERLSTEAIIRTLEGHKKATPQSDLFDLFADPQMPMAKMVDAYAHRNAWVNRMILGDSLAVMNSLLRYEGLGGQVQMIFMDPPYGVKFGSNFQPFVRKREVKHGDDEDMTREPEMVQAYRDTWELGLHSYLTYLRDRLTVAKDLLAPTGSVFVQISDDNLHHVRQVLDDVFGAENFLGCIAFTKTTGATAKRLGQVVDYLLWFARDATRVWTTNLYVARPPIDNPDERYVCVETPDGRLIDLSRAQKLGREPIPEGRILRLTDLTSMTGSEGSRFPVVIDGKTYLPPGKRGWSTTAQGIERLRAKGYVVPVGNSLTWKNYRDIFPFRPLNALWDDISPSGFGGERLYVVQTVPDVIARCILLTTRPGDLVLDPTCGGGTTAYAAETWGRRWITIDTSRVPLALTRQRLLSATYPWFKLKEPTQGPSGGFAYSRRKNTKGEEVGGVRLRTGFSSLANNEPPEEVVLVDQPDEDRAVTRVTGPFVFEAVLPTPLPLDEAAPEAPQDAPSDHIARMIEVLRRSPNLRLPGGGSVTLKNVRRAAKSLNLSAEAMVDHDASGAAVPLSAAVDAAHEKNTGGLPFSSQPVAILFGPPNGAVTAKAVLDAAKEANVKGYGHLYVIGFLFTAEARAEIMAGEDALGLPASPVEMTHDVMMGDLLKTQRSSQIFAITGSPEIAITRLPEDAEDGTPRWQVKLLGLDTFDPAAIKPHHLNGNDVPMWLLDIGWNGMAFSADQVFFPRTKAWESLRKALKATHEDSVWEHLAGDLSAPFAAPVGTEIAVKVLDDRGNELLKTAKLGA
jgi:adenine-specific DNA-methyltransferase